MASVVEPPWEELYTNLRGFVGRRVKNPADVDDLVQRVLLHIHRGLGSLRHGDRLHAWVYRTARNVIADHYRSPVHRRESLTGDADDVNAAVSADLLTADLHDDEAALRDLAACLHPLMRQLAPAHLEALTLTELHGLNQADAARRTGVSVSGMKSRVQRGRQQLRSILDECCRIQLDRRGGVVAFEPRHPSSCACGDCHE
jgi:RNA polymerase sigma-70 factor, ECF subfamily